MYTYLLNTKKTPKGAWRIEKNKKILDNQVFTSLVQAENVLFNPLVIELIKNKMARELGYGGMYIPSNSFEITKNEKASLLLIVFENGEKYLEWEINVIGD